MLTQNLIRLWTSMFIRWMLSRTIHTTATMTLLTRQVTLITIIRTSSNTLTGT